jgi:hypothetical protein
METRILPDSAERAYAAAIEPVRIEIEARFARVIPTGLIGRWRRQRAIDRQVRLRLSRSGAARLLSSYNV